jgi:hypothetical protein
MPHAIIIRDAKTASRAITPNQTTHTNRDIFANHNHQILRRRLGLSNQESWTIITSSLCAYPIPRGSAAATDLPPGAYP